MSESVYAPLMKLQKQYFQSGMTKPYSFRMDQLKKLKDLLQTYESKFNDALYADLRKHPQEVYTTEIGAVYEEINTAMRNLGTWMKPVRTGAPFFLFPSHGTIYPEPLGNVLIISPWNYPVLLSFRAVVAAIAAGNTIVLKPSELAPATSKVMADMINDHFDLGYLHVLEGDGATVVGELLDQFRFDHVFYTGSTAVGKIIMEKAAKHLSGVTLELGGKSPCIVSKDANLTVAAKRIVWGKLLNAGQSCVAPDYLLVHASIKQTFIDLLIKEIEAAYGTNPLQNGFGKIISAKRWKQLTSYLNQGSVLYGGQTDEQSLYVGPTIMEAVPMEAPLMKEEIFGPILPVFTYEKEEDVLKIIEQNPYPLALYVFTSSSKTSRFFMDNVRFGGGAINETVLHLGNGELPFGGVGSSGMGRYHGKFGFDTFSHQKGVLKRATWFEPAFRHPPYSEGKTKLWRWLLK